MLSIVSTPIGNLGDITLRAIATLTKCDGVICEDTRVTGNLLKQLNLGKKELISFHGNSDEGKTAFIFRKLKDGAHLALVTDAGTPGISDPGFAIVSRAAAEGIPTEVIPGPAAFLAALSGSGLPINRFMYLGFLPLKKGRRALIESFREDTDGEFSRTIVFYESVHRIERTLTEIAEALKDQPARPVVIARELTKVHEEFVRTTIGGLKEEAARIVKKGEFVVMIGRPATLKPL
ncbi:16S rRNA (cytidine(1402)-2'-O)-methyltransferase [Candidatus Peregrinibacteria bacterium]|nr:16S rRNA (cytidine(1402)-2'-O)-methyltransferase [Candidatus Peregrinibacteria bacterium]